MIHPTTGEDVCPWCRKKVSGVHSCYDVVEVLEDKIQNLTEAIQEYKQEFLTVGKWLRRYAK